MADDWQVGDLALCVKGGRCPVRGTEQPIRVGAVYHVIIVRVVPDDFGRMKLALGFAEFGTKRGYNAFYFRKIRPHTPDEQDAETIRLLNGERVEA